MKANRSRLAHRKVPGGEAMGVLEEAIDNDPEYPMFGYLQELDIFLDGVANGPWHVRQEEKSYQLLSRKGRSVLGVFYGPGARDTAEYVAKVNPREIAYLIQEIVRLKKAYEHQSCLYYKVLVERNELEAQLTRVDD